MASRSLTGFALAAACLVTLAGGRPAALVADAPVVAPLPSFSEPAIAPDGSEIAFVSAGDIWAVPVQGGAAHLLVSHAATESRPLYSPDARELAFVSNRSGAADIYIVVLATGALRRLTFDGGNQLDAWSRDGRWIYFSSANRDIAGMNDIYRVSPAGGTPMIVSGDRYVNEYFSSPSPDGRAVAFTARGMASSQWWRKGHSHIDEAEVWVLRDVDSAGAAYQPVTAGGAKEMWPLWSADGKRLYYVSDRTGAQNVWTKPVEGGQAAALTHFTGGRVLWPTISADGATIVFERDFGIWKLDTASGVASEVKIARVGLPAVPSAEHLTLTSQLQELALSPDGKKAAFVVHGEVFAASARDGGDAARVTSTPANEGHIAWAPDSRRLVYESDRDGVVHLFLYDFRTGEETRLTSAGQDDLWPRFSPDGKTIAFERGLKELVVIEIDPQITRNGNPQSTQNDEPQITPITQKNGSQTTRNGNPQRTQNDEPRITPNDEPQITQITQKETKAGVGPRERVLARGYLADRLDSGRPLAWSPDGRWIAFFQLGTKGFANVSVVPAAGGEARPVSFLANTNASEISWAPDGTFLLFDSGQRTEPTALARVDLILRTPRFREDQFRDLFQEETPAPSVRSVQQPPRAPAPEAPAGSGGKGATTAERKTTAKPVDIVFGDIRRRLQIVPVGVDISAQVVSPDGKWVLMVAGGAGQQNLYTYPLDELARERPVARQLTSTAGTKRFAQFSPDSKDVYYLEDGRIQAVSLERREPRAVNVSAEMDVEFATEKTEVFQQAWTYLRDEFYDADYHGADWEAVRATYAPRIAGAGTPDEVRRLISLMVGELNASHLGISGPPAGAQAATGRLGLRFDRLDYEQHQRLKISEVVPLSPSAVVGGIQAGEFLLAVDGIEVDARANLDALLNYKTGRRVVLTIGNADGKGRRVVAVRPVNAATEKALVYREWVEANRAYVAKASGGRLGYVHMQDMSAGALSQLYVDLDAENHGREGVVVDVRNNNGGFVNVYAIDVLARRGYLTMVQRGLPAAPARSVLGQRALESPTILITNQHSLSDAEDFTEGYRALKLGKVVGEPTAGWIIYTWSARLIDGSSLRLPRTKVTASDGTVMEMHPRPVDVPVTRPIGEGLQRRDSQLDVAVRELLQQIGARKSTT